MKLGDIELFSIVENRFRLDAGGIFGVIPKVIWSRMVKADESNLIPLDINPLIIKTGKDVLVVDTGYGDVLTGKLLKIQNLEGPTRWDDELKEHKLKPGDVTGVIFTHLHADHAMGGLRLGTDGKPTLRFPNAKYYVQRREWQDAMNPNERTMATYLVENLKLYEQSGKMILLDGDAELFPGVSVKLVAGHTPGMQAVIIQGGGKTVIYPSDLMPLRYNMKVPYIGAIDLDPTASMVQKRWLLDKLLNDGWIMAFDHDIEFKFARFVKDADGNIIPARVEEA